MESVVKYNLLHITVIHEFLMEINLVFGGIIEWYLAPQALYKVHL